MKVSLHFKNFTQPPSSGVAEFRFNDVEFIYGREGGVTIATIVGCHQLTNEGALRKTIEVQLQIEVL